ncbi:cyclase family protein [Acidaminobacter hydrogenoformans]|uniref:Kynurenine formamidase n=1 Tax=Acidaminobacter hydrogenoformans DSM 2784 TaxID=1120920 RepID=A0A1G5S172_9FIRM|nr:cyclase family protein [Acidaminobacter hydrogenoformans]SCZ79877.1 Kynurenine formamidase [Acidaminobacter hydrogenoformans DSM 2784]
MNHNQKWKIIDLSQEIFEGMSLYPIHQKTFIVTNQTHEKSQAATGSRLGFSARNLLISEHCGTHCDAVWEYRPDGETIENMPMSTFWGDAICLDVSHVPETRYIEIEDLDNAVKKAGLDIRKGDIVLMYTGHHERYYGKPAGEAILKPALGYYGGDEFQTRYTGISEDAARWLAEQGVVNIGIDAPAIDHPDDPSFAGHFVCGEYDMSNTENLCNLNLVANKRFLYFGLPLKIREGSGSPIRAVAILKGDE